jgi:hypothetical protein
MHALSKALFFSTGSVGLFTLVFFGAVVEFNTLSLKHFTQAMIEFTFMGYSLPEILWLGKPDSIADHLFKLKVGIGLIIGLGSLAFLIISFLPSTRIQFKFCSFAISLPLISVLLGFWIKFIHDDRTVLREEKMSLFSITLVSYPSAVLILWYGLHLRKRSPFDLNESKYVNFQPRVSPVFSSAPKDTAETQSTESEKLESDENGISVTTDEVSTQQLMDPDEASEELVVTNSDIEVQNDVSIDAKNEQQESERSGESEFEAELRPEQPEFTASEQEEVPDLTPQIDGNNASQNKNDDNSTESAEVVSENSGVDLNQSSSDDLRVGEKIPQSDQ